METLHENSCNDFTRPVGNGDDRQKREFENALPFQQESKANEASPALCSNLNRLMQIPRTHAIMRLECPSYFSEPLPHLVSCSPALSDDLGHFVDLSLRTAEGAQPLLCQLTGTLVLAVAQQFDYTSLIWCETVCPSRQCVTFQSMNSDEPDHQFHVPRDLSDNLSHECSSLAQMTFHARDARLGLAGSDFL